MIWVDVTGTDWAKKWFYRLAVRQRIEHRMHLRMRVGRLSREAMTTDRRWPVEPDQQTPTFAPSSVAATIRTLVGRADEVITRADNRHIWIFPRTVGTPIYLSIPQSESDVCDVYAGFAFHATVLAQEPPDDGTDIAGMVRAIINGEVTEFYDFGNTSSSRVPGRSFGLIGHHSPMSWTDSAEAIRRYDIPAWESRLS